jgi:hypothetical protein
LTLAVVCGGESSIHSLWPRTGVVYLKIHWTEVLLCFVYVRQNSYCLQYVSRNMLKYYFRFVTNETLNKWLSVASRCFWQDLRVSIYFQPTVVRLSSRRAVN